MDAFLLASVTAIAISLLLLASTIKIVGQKFHFTIGQFGQFAISRRAFSILGVTGSVILILAVIAALVGVLHPHEGPVYSMAEFFLGRRFAGTVLGFMFGTLLVFWARQLLLLKRGQRVTWAHRIEAAVLVALFALGGFSDAVSTIAKRLTTVSAGGVSLTFAVLGNSGSADGRSQQGVAATSAVDRKSLDALAFLASIGEFIDRDSRYVALIKEKAPIAAVATAPNAEASPAALLQRSLVSFTIRPLTVCLRSISLQTGDDADVNLRLVSLRPIFREIVSTHGHLSDVRVLNAAKQFAEVSDAFIAEIGRTYLNPFANKAKIKAISEDCRSLILLRCPLTISLADKDIFDGKLAEEIEDCINGPNAAENANKQIDDLRIMIQRVLDDGQPFIRPYIRLLYASLLWRLGDYTMAADQLEIWLRDAGAPNDDDIERQWDVIRVRTSLAVILEEWIRSSGNPPVLLLEHHLDNIKQTIALMWRMSPVRNAWKAFTDNGHDVVKLKFQRPTWSGDCKLSETWIVFRDQVALATTYLKQHMIYAYRAVQHHNYFDRFALDVTATRNAIMTINLSCYRMLLSGGSADRATDMLYAEMLETYAEVELANAARIDELPDPDAAKIRIDNALRAAKLGLEMVNQYARDEQNQARGSVFKATGLQKAIELQYLLRRVLRRAQEGMRQL